MFWPALVYYQVLTKQSQLIYLLIIQLFPAMDLLTEMFDPYIWKLVGFGALIGFLSPLIFAIAMSIIGFGCIGITAGSCAAGWQAMIGNVWRGSSFACKC